MIFDLEKQGSALINLGNELADAVQTHRPDLLSIGSLMEAWFWRDLRFVLLPSTWTDYGRRPSTERMTQRSTLFRAIEDALSYQLQDWGSEHERFEWLRPPDSLAREVIDRVPDHLDRAMLDAAWCAGVDVFVTSDRKLRQQVIDVPSDFPNVWSPSELEARMPVQASGRYWESGTIEHDGCQWAGGMLMGDLGRMSRLLEVLR